MVYTLLTSWLGQMTKYTYPFTYVYIDGDYENEGYEEYDDIEWPSSPSKSAAKLWSLKKDMDQGKDLGKGQYASVKEALLSLTRHDKPKKTMNLNRVMKIAEPKKLKVQRKFGKDEEEMNCYFKVLR